MWFLFSLCSLVYEKTISHFKMNFLFALLASVSALTVTVKCNDNGRYGPDAIYRMVISPDSRVVLRLYPSVRILESWVPNYTVNEIGNCNGLVFGQPMDWKN